MSRKTLDDFYKEAEEKRNVIVSALVALGCKIPEYKWAIECPVGWNSLVIDCAKAMLALGWNGEITQIKQKMGGLRFYIGRAKDYIHDTVHAFEAHSFHICEECGEPGEYRATKPRIATLCDHCEGVAMGKWDDTKKKTE